MLRGTVLSKPCGDVTRVYSVTSAGASVVMSSVVTTGDLGAFCAVAMSATDQERFVNFTNEAGSLTRKPYSASARIATRLFSNRLTSAPLMVTAASVETL